MQFRSALAIAIALSVSAAMPADAAEKSEQAVKAGSTGLVINNSDRINLNTSVSIDFLNRFVGDGRRKVRMRLAQPMLCGDFTALPVSGNPVAFEYLDPNGDGAGRLIFGGISSYQYFTNGASPSHIKISSDGNLACCIMQPAPNASCFQGSLGGGSSGALFANGFETILARSSAKGTPVADLAVAVTATSTSVAPGANFAYTITVTNVGGVAVSGARVYDWFPKASGAFAASLGTGSWTCAASAGASCGVPSGSGNIALIAVSLAPGSNVSFSVNRPVSGAAPNGSSISVSAAAFAPPVLGETVLANNQGFLTATVAPTSFSIGDVTLAEGNTGSSNFQFVITRSNTSTASSVQVSTANGSASAGSDYTAITNQTVNFAANGSATAIVPVAVAGDTVLEANETFTVNLSNPVGGSIGDGVGQGTITNDDAASIAIGDVAVTEGGAGGTINATFIVTLTGGVQGGFTVPVSSSNGSATAGLDYTAISGGTSLSFAGTVGETKTISVTVIGDTMVEPNETFNVILGVPSNGAVTVSDGTGVGTIINDDAASLSINDVTVIEGDTGNTTPASFIVTLSNAVQGGFTVPVSSADLTATAGSDYTAIANGTNLTFTGSAGETKVITVQVNGDALVESNETYEVNLGSPSSALINVSDGTGLGTIIDDDAP